MTAATAPARPAAPQVLGRWEPGPRPVMFGCAFCGKRYVRLDALLAHWRKCRAKAAR